MSITNTGVPKAVSGARTAKARPRAPLTGDARKLAFPRDTRLWLQRMIRKHSLIVDVGPDFKARRSGDREGLSPYYYMEYMISHRLPIYIHRWDEPYKGLWSDLPFPRRFAW